VTEIEKTALPLLASASARVKEEISEQYQYFNLAPLALFP